MEPEEIELTSESTSMEKGSVYIKMQLNDVLLYSEEHLKAVCELIKKHDDLTHIVSEIGFLSCNMDKAKLFKDNKNKEEIKLDNFVFAMVVAKIDRKQSSHELMASNILLQIDEYIKKYIQLH